MAGLDPAISSLVTPTKVGVQLGALPSFVMAGLDPAISQKITGSGPVMTKEVLSPE